MKELRSGGETEREDGVTRRIAKTVTFKDGLPSTFESTTVTFDASNGSKNVTPDTILLDGAVTYPGKYDKPTGEGGSDEEQRTIVDEYADLLKAAKGLKINGQDYDVFNAISNEIRLSSFSRAAMPMAPSVSTSSI